MLEPRCIPLYVGYEIERKVTKCEQLWSRLQENCAQADCP